MPTQRDRMLKQFADRGVNREKGSSRFGQRFKVVTKGGVRYHDYGGGRLIADKAAPTGPRTTRTTTPGVTGGTRAPSRPAAPRRTPPTPPPATPTPGGFTTDPAARERLRAAATGTGRFLNVAEQSPSYGQRFGIVQRGGKRYHRYRPGRLVADVERGAGTARYKRRARKPAVASPAPPVA